MQTKRHSTMTTIASDDLHPVLAAVLTLLVAGCGAADGPQRVPIQGTVLLGGQPLECGMIRFIPMATTKGPAAVAIINEGAYQLSDEDGPVVGTHRVEIEATNFVGFDIDDEQAYAARVAKAGPRINKDPIPERYHRRSTLTVEIKADDDRTFDFDLKAEPRTPGAR